LYNQKRLQQLVARLANPKTRAGAISEIEICLGRDRLEGFLRLLADNKHLITAAMMEFITAPVISGTNDAKIKGDPIAHQDPNVDDYLRLEEYAVLVAKEGGQADMIAMVQTYKKLAALVSELAGTSSNHELK
jgi:hypothetical protein